MKNNKLRFLLISLLIIASMIFAAACGVDTSTLAGNVSQVTDAEEAEADAPPESTDEDAALSDAEDFLASIPEWKGYAFCYVNNNVPDFEEDEIWTATQESLDPLDDLGRCGTANSCIGRDGMPTQPRGDISEVHPTGWHTERYDFVEGEALYNRCHLIAHQLSGDDAIPRNLITGTSYMNRDGMLPFEEAIGNYVRETGNHVMYRVTPVFKGDELIARGVHMQAISVEDDGAGISFNVFCYNVQPGIDIEYDDGDNKLSEDRSMLEAYQAGKFTIAANTCGEVDTRTENDEDETADTEQKQDEPKSDAQHYVLNTNTKKFHYPDCNSVSQMADHNKQEVDAAREELIARGFEPCGNCKP